MSKRPYWDHYRKRKKLKKKYNLGLTGAPLSGSFATSLRCTPATASLEDAETGGHLRLAKHSRERKLRRAGRTIWNLWLVFTNIVFAHTAFVAIGKRQLQSPLIVFLHGSLIHASSQEHREKEITVGERLRG